MEPSRPGSADFDPPAPKAEADSQPERLAPTEPVPAAPGASASPPAAEKNWDTFCGPEPQSLPPPASAAPSGPRVVRGYRLGERLGKGAFGVVYKATSPGGVEVAVKMTRNLLDRPESNRELDALKLIKTLRHPFLLSLHDFWVEGEDLYTVTELADQSLCQLAQERGKGGMAQADLMQVFAEVAEALDYLHSQRVLHRDIKPANILLLGAHAKVADLGLAKFNPEEVAVSSTSAGTPLYMAPESLNRAFRPEGDQYALALCYAELRLGRPVCEGSNTVEVMLWHLSGTPKLDGLEAHEQEAVRRALNKDAAKRFPSCQAFIQALQPPRPAPDPSLVPPAPPPRSRWLEWATLVCGVLLVTLLLSRLWPKSRDVWLPPGFTAPADANKKELDGKSYYDCIVKLVGGRDVVFWLIPHEGPGDPRTFYMMENKVSNGLFKEAVERAEFQNTLTELRAKYPGLEWDQWRKGGIRRGVEDVGSGDDTLPVLRVNVMEAYAFARWFGGPVGNLPTVEQWDAAGGKGRGASAPFLDPDRSHGAGEIAINRREEGPMPVGTAPRDVSFFHCKDMAGNGLEWTRAVNREGTPVSFPPLITPGRESNYNVTVLGQSYYREKEFRFDMSDSKLFSLSYPDVGFRVVLEP